MKASTPMCPRTRRAAGRLGYYMGIECIQTSSDRQRLDEAPLAQKKTELHHPKPRSVGAGYRAAN